VDFRRKRIARAATASRDGPCEVVLVTPFIRPGNGETLSGGHSPPAELAATRRHAGRTVSLSDGTTITFVTARSFTEGETA
jgi:hypothetical protein